MFPLVVPCVGYDDHLGANIAIALTGMGVDMGQDLNLDVDSDAFFDDNRITHLNEQYVNHKMSLSRFLSEMNDYFSSRSEPWGFKISSNLSMLAVYRHVFPDMVLLAPVPEPESSERLMFAAMVDDDTPKAVTLVEFLNDRRRAIEEIEFMSRKVRTVYINSGLFYDQREKALMLIAETLGAQRGSKDIGRMVRSAERKMQFVYMKASNHGNYR